ncbi:MAG: CRISPR-associated helicase Cas3', partial [Promethearchaeia archaeon]
MKKISLKSHPEKKLFFHLRNSANLSRKITRSKCLENSEILSEIAYLIGVAHDFAKSTTFFQDWLENDKRSEKARHGHLSSLFGYYLVKKYLDKNNLSKEFDDLPAISFVVINKHHGNLLNIRGGYSSFCDKIKDDSNKKIIEEQIRDIRKNHLDEVKSIYNELLEEFSLDSIIQAFFEILDEDPYSQVYQSLKGLMRRENLKKYTEIMFFYSVLLDSDKLDASGIESIPSRWKKSLEKEIVDNFKEKKFGKPESEINKVREEAYNNVNNSIEYIELDERLLSINLPTGSGKTLTALSAAFNLRKRIEEEFGFSPKIVYSLPFLSIIDQNSSVFREVLAEEVGLDYEEVLEMGEEERESLLTEGIPSNLLLTHHHLTDVKYREKREKNEIYDYEDLLNSLLLTEGWYSEIIVSTFVQLFHSLITNKNRSARKFHNITNSIIILDEVQSIPFKYWRLVNKILRILSRKYNCWILFMTATKPLIFNEDEMVELATKKKKYFNFFDRINYDFKLELEDLDELKNSILKDVDDEDIMIVMNTINSCKKLFGDLKTHFSENRDFEIDEDGICIFDNFELINLSTNILPSIRIRRIERIKNDNKRKIIVTTQLVEAGVDISVDTIYRDLAPLDSIIQTGGRCNREFGKDKGITKVVKLKDENNNYNYFYSYIYDRTIIGITEKVIEKFGEKVSERKFTLDGANDYFEKILD